MAGKENINDWAGKAMDLVGMGGGKEKLDVSETVTKQALTELQAEIEAKKQAEKTLTGEDKVNLFLTALLEGGQAKGLMDYLGGNNLNPAQKTAFEDEFAQGFMDDSRQLDEMIVSNSVDLARVNAYVDEFVTSKEWAKDLIEAAEANGTSNDLFSKISDLRNEYPDIAALLALVIPPPKAPKEGEKPSIWDGLYAQFYQAMTGEGEAKETPETAADSANQVASGSTEGVESQNDLDEEKDYENYRKAFAALKPSVLDMMKIVQASEVPEEEQSGNLIVQEVKTLFENVGLTDPAFYEHRFMRMAELGDWTKQVFGRDVDVDDGELFFIKDETEVEVKVKEDENSTTGGAIAMVNGQKLSFDGTPEDLKQKLEEKEII